MPRLVIVAPLLAVTLPPSEAVVCVTLLAAVVVTLGAKAEVVRSEERRGGKERGLWIAKATNEEKVLPVRFEIGSLNAPVVLAASSTSVMPEPLIVGCVLVRVRA